MRIREFRFDVDEPPLIGGTDAGPTPVELVLAALGTCQEIVYATYARVLGIPLDGVAVSAEGRLDLRGFFGVADVPAGFQDVSFAVYRQPGARSGRRSPGRSGQCPLPGPRHPQATPGGARRGAAQRRIDPGLTPPGVGSAISGADVPRRDIPPGPSPPRPPVAAGDPGRPQARLARLLARVEAALRIAPGRVRAKDEARRPPSPRRTGFPQHPSATTWFDSISSQRKQRSPQHLPPQLHEPSLQHRTRSSVAASLRQTSRAHVSSRPFPLVLPRAASTGAPPKIAMLAMAPARRAGIPEQRVIASARRIAHDPWEYSPVKCRIASRVANRNVERRGV